MVAVLVRATGSSTMRATVFVLSFAATCFGAQASSIVAPGAEPAATPSIIMLGAPEPAATPPAAFTAVPPAGETPSIVALGEPAPGISYDKVAAIPQPFSPMVIRGGIAGGPSADPMPAKAEPAPAQAGLTPDRQQAQPEPSSASGSQQAAGTAPMRQPR